MSPGSPSRSPWLLGVWLAASACTPLPVTTRATWTPSELAAQGRCEAGDPAGCGELGRSLLSANRDQRDVERALVLLEGACGRDDDASCTMLADWYAERGDHSALARARQLSARACDRGSVAACAQRRDGATPPEQRLLATNGLAAQCGRGDGAACETLGFKAKQTHDLEAEKRGFAEACRFGRPLSCYLFGSLQMNEAASRSAGAALLERTCLGGHAISCFSAMSFSAPIVGDRPSCARVRPLADRACQTLNYDRSDGCAMLDACRIEAKTDVAAAVKSLRASCDDGISLACFYWAAAQVAATAGAPSEAAGAEILGAYESACRGRSAAAPAACAQLDLIQLTMAKSSDATLGPIAHLSWACDHGKGAACCALAEVYTNGRFAPPAPDSAAIAHLKACALTQQSCCVPGAP